MRDKHEIWDGAAGKIARHSRGLGFSPGKSQIMGKRSGKLGRLLREWRFSDVLRWKSPIWEIARGLPTETAGFADETERKVPLDRGRNNKALNFPGVLRFYRKTSGGKTRIKSGDKLREARKLAAFADRAGTFPRKAAFGNCLLRRIPFGRGWKKIGISEPTLENSREI